MLTNESDLETRCHALLVELNLVSADTEIAITPLTGGVASDIALVSVDQRQWCVKFALPKLKVAADWFAPVERNAAEYAWLTIANEVAPDNAVKLFGRSEKLHGFAMEYLSGPNTYLWKTALLAVEPEQDEAMKVGDLLGRIHKTSTTNTFATISILSFIRYKHYINPRSANEVCTPCPIIR